MCSISSFLSEEEECSHVSTALESHLSFSRLFFALPLLWVDDELVVVQLSKKKSSHSHQHSLLTKNFLISSVLSRRRRKKKKKNGIIVLEKRFGVEIVGE